MTDRCMAVSGRRGSEVDDPESARTGRRRRAAFWPSRAQTT